MMFEKADAQKQGGMIVEFPGHIADAYRSWPARLANSNRPPGGIAVCTEQATTGLKIGWRIRQGMVDKGLRDEPPGMNRFVQLRLVAAVTVPIAGRHLQMHQAPL